MHIQIIVAVNSTKPLISSFTETPKKVVRATLRILRNQMQTIIMENRSLDDV